MGPSSQLNLRDSNSANNVATPSIITSAADGFTRQRISMSGSVATKGLITLEFGTNAVSSINNGDGTRAYDWECVVELGGAAGTGGTGITGLTDIFVRTNGVASDTPSSGDSAGGFAGDLWPDGFTGTLFLYSTVPEVFAAGAAFTTASLFAGFSAAKLCAGDIDVSRASFQQVSANF